MKKRILSAFMALCLVLTLLPVSTLAQKRRLASRSCDQSGWSGHAGSPYRGKRETGEWNRR